MASINLLSIFFFSVKLKFILNSIHLVFIVSNSLLKLLWITKKNVSEIEEDETLLSKKIEIVGLYDPELNGLKIDMWLNSDGEKVLNLLNKINKIKLSDDAKKILNISLLTNSYSPKKNISNDKLIFLKVISSVIKSGMDIVGVNTPEKM